MKKALIAFKLFSKKYAGFLKQIYNKNCKFASL